MGDFVLISKDPPNATYHLNGGIADYFCVEVGG